MRTTSTLLALASVLTLAACGTSTEAETEMTMSMKDLVALGDNFTCTFADHIDDVGMTSNGTMYMEGKKNFRADFTMKDKSGKTYTSHMISANDTSYMWSDETPGGMMVKLDADEDVFSDSDDESTFDENEKLNMKCRKWNPTASTFTPPKDREFVDFKAQIDAMIQGSGGGNSMCSACDMAGTETEKAECRKALGC